MVDITPIKKIVPVTQPSAFQGAMDFIWSNIWLVILFLSIGCGIFIFLYIWKKSEQKINPFLEDWNRTKKLCKQFRRLHIGKVLRFHSSTGLETLGSYEGECYTKDNSVNVMFSTWKWGIIGKIIRIVFFPLRPMLSMVMKNYHIVKADQEENLVTWDSENVTIRCFALSSSSFFLSPVLIDKDGKLIDDRDKVFEKAKQTALNDTLYSLTQDFANIMRERINLETVVRYEAKKQGSEISSGQQQQTG